ncbi:MAG: hypothetical protein DRN20_03105 [Thermoplasmata archaeon]|nr:MAG: hypothetical protein DRN20_03105 [Thermoplasmata archaeon]
MIVNTTITNNGTAPAKNLFVRIYVKSNMTLIGNYTISRLDPHESTILTAYWTAVAGNHTIWVVVDSDSTIINGYISDCEVNISVNALPRPVIDIYQRINTKFVIVGTSSNKLTAVNLEDGGGHAVLNTKRLHKRVSVGKTILKARPKKNYALRVTYNATRIGSNMGLITMKFNSSIEKIKVFGIYTHGYTVGVITYNYNGRVVRVINFSKGRNVTIYSNITALIRKLTEHNQTYWFDATHSYDPDGYIVNYTWNFGDGCFGYGNITKHTYGSQGVYYVVLKVVDNNNATNFTAITFDPDSFEPNITISNLGPTSVTISWYTEINCVGYVMWGTSPNNMSNIAYCNGTYHYCTLRNLTPQTQYYFIVYSNDQIYNNNGTAYNFTTLKIANNVPSPYIIYGQVVSNDYALQGVPVYLKAILKNGSTSLLKSTLTDDKGYFSMDVGTLRYKDDNFVSYDYIEYIEIYVINNTCIYKLSGNPPEYVGVIEIV